MPCHRPTPPNWALVLLQPIICALFRLELEIGEISFEMKREFFQK